MFQLSDSDIENEELNELENEIKRKPEGVLSFGVQNEFNHYTKKPRLEPCSINIKNSSFRFDNSESYNTSPSYSPTTSTQIPNLTNKKSINIFVNKTNMISPIKMRPGISCDLRRSEASTLPITNYVRKFPGPAGRLPKLKQYQSFNSISMKDVMRNDEKQVEVNQILNTASIMSSNQNLSLSLYTNNIEEDEEESELWNLTKSLIGSECWAYFVKYTIKNVLEMIRSPNCVLMNSKIPVMCVKMDAIDFLLSDAACTMSDDTGSLKCAIHHQVLCKYQDKIRIGAVFILKKISIFSPSGKKYYLNVTESNIVDVMASVEEFSSLYRTSTSSSSFKSIITVDLIRKLIEECNQTHQNIVESNENIHGVNTMLSSSSPYQLNQLNNTDTNISDEEMDELFMSFKEEDFEDL